MNDQLDAEVKQWKVGCISMSAVCICLSICMSKLVYTVTIKS